ncbi:MAG: TIGR01777 family protein [Deltaproteobacteria bacterium]|nr:TIGR01777 family protein [Deltaproteobacteria bacterium]
MKVFVTGGTGFVGTFLCRELALQGHDVTILTRKQTPPTPIHTRIGFVTGDPTVQGPWMAAVGEHDWVINLAGASIFSYWTEKKKQEIYDSRILTTRNLVAALARGERPRLFCSTSAPGFYGDRGEEELTEASPPGTDFLARLAQDWEAEALKAQELGLRVAVTRFGVVLGPGGGILEKLTPLFRAFVGGPAGSGQQWFSWIHQMDLVGAFLFLLKNQELSGPVNFTAPHPVRNRDLAKALGRALNRPAWLPAPQFMMRLVMGELADVVLTGQKVLPAKLTAAGFQFLFPTIDLALGHILGEKGK